MPLKNNRNSRDDKSPKNRYTKPSSGSGSRYSKTDRPDDSTKRKSFGDDRSNSYRGGSEKREERPYRKQFGDDADKREGFRSGPNRADDRPYKNRFGGESDKKAPFRAGKADDRPYKKRSAGDNDKRAPFKSNSGRADERAGRPSRFGDKRTGRAGSEGENRGGRYERTDSKGFAGRKYDDPEKRNWSSEERFENKTLRNKKPAAPKENDGLIRLNRYIANAGICSRRKADELIQAGVVSVNGEVVSELGYKVDPGKDVIRYNGETLKREKMVYVLLNKPKDYITTTDDPQERRTVMQLVEKASKERIYPVGRLDRNTTGLLLMTNDGDLADKLSHPRNNITKIYQVELNKSLTQGDLNKIEYGLELEDGMIKPDAVSYVQGGSKREIGIQIHSGKNRIVRRIFEHLGYEVVKLDRVVYGNLTKKDLPRGRWRHLEEKEIIQLKHMMK